MSNTLVQKNAMTQKEKDAPRPAPRRVVFTPHVDVLETQEALVLQIDMPGVKSDAVEVHFERGELTVIGRREPANPKGRSLVQEFEVGDYYRAFLISQDVAPDEISAELKNGVLKVTLPKAKAALPRRISVTGN